MSQQQSKRFSVRQKTQFILWRWGWRLTAWKRTTCSNSLIMLCQCFFSVALIKISIWSSLVKTFRKKFKSFAGTSYLTNPLLHIHHRRQQKREVERCKQQGPTSQCFIRTSHTLESLLSKQSLREQIETIISYRKCFFGSAHRDLDEPVLLCLMLL